MWCQCCLWWLDHLSVRRCITPLFVLNEIKTAYFFLGKKCERPRLSPSICSHVHTHGVASSPLLVSCTFEGCVMVYILAHDVVLCLLLDRHGDPTAVQSFVQNKWDSLRETQLPSTMSLVCWLWHSLKAKRGQQSGEIDEDEVGDGIRVATVPGGNSPIETPYRARNAVEPSHAEFVESPTLATSTSDCYPESTPLTSRVAKITVKQVLQWVKKARPTSDGHEFHFAGEADEPSNHTSRERNVTTRCRTAEDLWVLTRLVALVRHAVATLMRQLLPLSCQTNGQRCDQAEEEEIEEDDHSRFTDFPHECVVLVPLHVCRSIRGLSLRQVIAICTQKQTVLSEWSKSRRSVSFIINPALPPTNNPHRAEKNKRLDRIQQAVFAQYYESMAHSSNRRANGAFNPVIPLHQDEAQGLQNRKQEESFSSFLRGASIGFDMQLMALSGGAVGYYLGYVRGRPANDCIVYATVGLVLMLLVDALLLILMLRRQDESLRRERQNRWKWLQPIGRDEKKSQRGEDYHAEGRGSVVAAALNAKKNA
ncbi:hypothetical protein, conserved [Trypanosoma brucei brucei TREU927]|uniref:Transmembrane protein n=1 Tax=Trypanosoma brucei brucei (strain 927/4 GUTat10.1) TaxID=185431 RepID=Q585F8_TRYB2|nr:hypothetical protein, conserved [Trypanosoma brucei brucei TREU927]AAX80344.1 hypothetical protein, conserved [Trypanosoma brucei]AAZ11652.1 hypothetical protein, conserved [Trypanosoma brucei brucei TREU927]